MILRTPHYFHRFKCTASFCRDNCCRGGWQIDIDDETVKKYGQLEGDIKEKINSALQYTDVSCFALKNGACPFLDEDGLCSVYKELGEEYMGIVCRQFPRFAEYYGGIKEMGIGLACEEAARIILTDDGNFSYEQTIINEEEYDDAEYDDVLAERLFFLRSYFFDLLNNRTIPLKNKLTEIIKIAAATQEHINKNEYAQIAPHDYDVEKIPFSEEYVKEIWYIYSGLEILNEEWSKKTDEIFKVIHPNDSDNTKAYLERTAALNRFSDEKLYTNLAAYYIYRYFMKSAYDHNVFGKIQLLISSLVIIKDLELMDFLKKNRTDTQSLLDGIHIFSRETEYSEDNVEELYEEFVFGNGMGKEELISIAEAVM